MARVQRFELLSVDLPLRRPFRHAAATREVSESLFLKCVTDTGAVGFGESLPRRYVTGETREGAFAWLRDSVLPHWLGREFASWEEVRRAVADRDGSPPHLAAWCAVDLALLDAFGHAFGQPVRLGVARDDDRRYSAVVSAEAGWGTLLKLRLYGLAQVKLKVGADGVLAAARRARRVLGQRSALRVDANMAWDVTGALANIRGLAQEGIRCVEQPVDADDLDGLARLVRETAAEIIADESFRDGPSLARLVEQRACRGVNVRISKCGGLLAAARRCEEASRAGLTVQLGCQVGESSLLSAAHLILRSAVPQARYLEGCYGEHLLRADPVRPGLQLGYGGRAPPLPGGPGLGVVVDEVELGRWVTKRARLERGKEGGDDVVDRQTSLVADRAEHGEGL